MSFIAENAIWSWVNFNGRGTVSIRDSFRVSSVSDLGTGYYRVNLSSSAGNAACTVVGGYEDNQNTNVGTAYAMSRRGSYSANSHRIRTYSPASNRSFDFLHLSAITMKS